MVARRFQALVAVAVGVLVATALGLRYAGDSRPAWLDQVALSLAREWFPMPRGVAMIVISAYDLVPLAIMIGTRASGVRSGLRADWYFVMLASAVAAAVPAAVVVVSVLTGWRRASSRPPHMREASVPAGS